MELSRTSLSIASKNLNQLIQHSKLRLTSTITPLRKKMQPKTMWRLSSTICQRWTKRSCKVIRISSVILTRLTSTLNKWLSSNRLKTKESRVMIASRAKISKKLSSTTLRVLASLLATLPPTPTDLLLTWEPKSLARPLRMRTQLWN